MTSWERCWRLGTLACLVAACGQAPPAPTAVESPNPSTGRSSAGQTNVLEALPQNPSTPATPATAAPATPGPAATAVGSTQPLATPVPNVDAGATSESPPLPPEPTPASPPTDEFFGACRAPRLTGCDDVYVTFVSPAADLCVQLSLDDCGAFRQSLQVDVPVSWRLSTATVGKAANCNLGVYDPSSTPALSASGRVTWNEDGRELSDVAVDLTLQAPAGLSTPTTVSVKTKDPIKQLVKCD